VSEALRAQVFLNGLSSSFEAQVGAVGAFLAGRQEIKVISYVTLVRTFEESPKLGRYFGPCQERVWLKADYFQPERLLEHIKSYEGDLALFPPGLFGAQMAGRLAARLKGSAVLNLIELEVGARLLAKKYVYSENLLASLALKKKPYCLALSKEWSAKGHEILWQEKFTGSERWLELEPDGLDPDALGPDGLGPDGGRPEEVRASGLDLAKAQALVVSGFGLGDPATLARAIELAQRLSAEWGVSRPVAMNAWAPLERLIGVSGAMTAPKWALCLGASGAAALLSGLSQAQKLIAVNLDPEAPIMSRSDLAVVGQAQEIIEALNKLLA
jgi:electron transfer flavoprotein alpha subunit